MTELPRTPGPPIGKSVVYGQPLKRTLLVGGCAIAVLVGLVGCGSSGSGSSQGPPGETPKQATAEYRSEQASLSLPPGAAWPKTPIASRAPDAKHGIIYQPGYARNQADFHWLCSWATALGSAPAGGSSAARAQKQIEGLKSTYVYQHGSDPGARANLGTIANSVGLGDYGPLEQFASVNC